MGATKTVCQELHRVNLHGRAAIAKPLVTRANAKRRFQWCHQGKSLAVDYVKHVLFSDESTFTVFPTSGKESLWPLCRTCLCQSQDELMLYWWQKEALHTNKSYKRVHHILKWIRINWRMFFHFCYHRAYTPCWRFCDCPSS